MNILGISAFYHDSAACLVQDGVILAAHYAPASPYATGFIISPDLGETWAQYDLQEFGKRSPVRFHKKNQKTSNLLRSTVQCCMRNFFQSKV